MTIDEQVDKALENEDLETACRLIISIMPPKLGLLCTLTLLQEPELAVFMVCSYTAGVNAATDRIKEAMGL